MSMSAPRPSVFRSLQGRVFALTWLSYASYYLTRKNFSVVKTELESSFGLSLLQLGTIDTLYLALYAAGQFISGGLGDRFGPRRIIGLGMMCSAGCAWVFSGGSVFMIFLLAFGLNGLCQSTGWSNNVKAMAAWFPRKGRGTVMGVWCTCYSVGGAVATGLAGWLFAEYGWRWAFVVPAVWVAGVGVLVLLFLVERPEDRGMAPVDDPVTDVDAHVEGGDSPTLIRVLRLPEVWQLGGAYCGIKLIRYSLLFWLPYYLARQHAYEKDVSAYIATAFEIGGIAGAIATGWLSDQFFGANRARVSVLCLLLLAGALLTYPVIGALGVWPNVIVLGVIGFLLFGPDALISGAAAQDVGGADTAASAAGIINGMGSIGAILQGVVTAVVSDIFGWSALFYLFIGLALVSALALVPLARKRPSPPGRAS